MSAEIVSKPQKGSGIFSTGLALFSMFFGAGNLIFPLLVGRHSGTETTWAILGLGISAVAFPFLGLMAMMCFNGNLQAFLSRMGRWPAIALLFILQMSQGPVGAMPRLVTLMHASIKPYFPALSLMVFSLLICTLVFYLTVRPQKIIHLLGVILTPLLLLTLAVLVLVGSIWAPEAPVVLEGGMHHFGQGLKLGYQTMDLTAALLFATLILPHLSQGTDDVKVIKKRMFHSSLIASGLLMAAYIGLCWISAYHSAAFPDVAPEDLLQRISVKLLGPFGGILASAAVFLACLTTAISLSAVFSQYLQRDWLQNNKGNVASLGITLGLTAVAANLGFSGIVKLWGPLLEILYPALIVLCLLNIAYSIYKVKPIRTPVFFALGLAMAGLLS